eukprot:6383802-Prymnesium_polylepis.1
MPLLSSWRRPPAHAPSSRQGLDTYRACSLFDARAPPAGHPGLCDRHQPQATHRWGAFPQPTDAARAA